MKTLVVYDSVHGNTKEIAQEVARSIGRGLPQNVEVQLIHIQDFKVDHLADVDLLVLGAPVRRHDISPAVEKFLESLPACALHGVAVATFDTRFRVAAWLSGSAAGKMARLLRRLGARQVAQAESFRLDTKMGPLSPGELERAEVWASSLPNRLSAAA
jgi:flavodoxin